MGNSTDKRNKLRENPFRYQLTKSQRVLIYSENRFIKTLNEKESVRFIAGIHDKTEHEVQLLLARITGNFKHGNENLTSFKKKSKLNG